jgi:hypothetical protein
MQRLIMLNSELFAVLADTRNWPIAVDSPIPQVSAPKSFKDSFCAAFFHTNEMQACYKLYLDLIFWNNDLATIRKRLNHYCCKGKRVHMERCRLCEGG